MTDDQVIETLAKAAEEKCNQGELPYYRMAAKEFIVFFDEIRRLESGKPRYLDLSLEAGPAAPEPAYARDVSEERARICTLIEAKKSNALRSALDDPDAPDKDENQGACLAYAMMLQALLDEIEAS